jgi:hypothetical protein
MLQLHYIGQERVALEKRAIRAMHLAGCMWKMKSVEFLQTASGSETPS